jgi:hypothetical protein
VGEEGWAGKSRGLGGFNCLTTRFDYALGQRQILRCQCRNLAAPPVGNPNRHVDALHSPKDSVGVVLGHAPGQALITPLDGGLAAEGAVDQLDAHHRHRGYGVRRDSQIAPPPRISTTTAGRMNHVNARSHVSAASRAQRVR